MQVRPSLIVLPLLLAGCAPRQDPGIPLPPPQSAADALHRADLVVGKKADLVAGIDAARKVVADNLANAETTGYRALTCQVFDGRPRLALSVEEGSLRNTGRDLDIAIAGPNGFLRVKVVPTVGDGTAYTRNGNLFRDKNGDLVVGMGNGLPINPPITIPNNATGLTISQDGRVSATLPGQTAQQVLGQINLYRFADASALSPHAASLYLATDASGPPIESRPGDDGTGTLQQGFLEDSNVELNREKLRTEYLERWRQTVLASSDIGP